MSEHLFDLFPHASDPVWPDRPRYLLSFAYVNQDQVDLCRKHGFDLVIDSGAFTTAASGKQMDHSGYLDWLRANADAITFALSLDVIGDYRESRYNHNLALERVGDVVRMVPTYHLGSPFNELERLCRTYDLVSIGGAVPFAKQQRHLMTAFKQIHRIAAEHGTKLHGLGMTGNRIIHGFPWWSLDSSAWLSPVRFPSLPLADRDGRLVQMEHGWKLTRAERALVSRYGGDPDVVATPGWSLNSADTDPEVYRQRREWVVTACARSFMYVEAVKASQQPDSPTRVYLSGAAPTEDGTAGAIYRAHQLGTPYPAATNTTEGIAS